ncbi:glycoside hydrolase family 19 protein [Massilia sp. PWRC2]|uniref:glycoside hydrolase family 19 protein n=1 Tax=Massilia sp. PWRC2 TaxID=2804626 RepID=UPI003CF9DE41
MKTVWGACVLTNELNVFHELLPTETSVVDPGKQLNSAKDGSGNGFQKIIIDKKSYWVSDDQMTSSEIDIPHPKNKKINIKETHYFANGKELRCYKKNPVKNHTILAAGTKMIPSLDLWMTAGEFREEKVNEKIWVQVYVPATNDLYWAEKSAIHYYSDADWRDFLKLEETGSFSQDGFIDDDGMQKLFEKYEQDRADKKLTGREDTEDKLRHLIARHPTEWSKQGSQKRFGRVTQEDFGASKLTAEQFTNLTAHIERLSFWEQVPGLPAPASLWHAHPVKFIEHLAKCLWLSKDELQLIYPEKSNLSEQISHGTSDEIREKYRLDINKCVYRYGVNSRLRQAHFFGQGAIESMSLNKMVEDASGAGYEKSKKLGNCQPGDGPRFKGRGFKQLTGRYNYAEYWCFKGWLKKGVDFDIGWEQDTTKRYPPVEKPERLIETTFNCIDSGCWYITLFRKATIAAMDADNVPNVTYAINGGDTNGPERLKFTNRIKKQIL